MYEMLDGNVRCCVCGRRCVIAVGKTGFCGVRKNVDGKLYSLVYGKACSTAIDPIEKKPFFHFAPGTRSLSVATVGCNFRCQYCQNYLISQEYGKIGGEDLSPEQLVKLAKASLCDGIAYTYTEPTIFYEYCYDTMVLAETSLYNVWVTNGYMTPEAVHKLAAHLDAANVDFKGDARFYRKLCGVPDIQPLYDCLKTLVKHEVWVEITNLLIPGWNDRPDQIQELVSWVRDNLGPKIPMHFSAFYPAYKMLSAKPTPVETIELAIRIAKDFGMYYVYSGNVPGHKNESTYCHSCGRLLIKRFGFTVKGFEFGRDMRCPECGKEVILAGKRWIPENLFKT